LFISESLWINPRGCSTSAFPSELTEAFTGLSPGDSAKVQPLIDELTSNL